MMLTDLLSSFVHQMASRHSAIFAHANKLFMLFLAIEISLFGIYLALEGGDVIMSLFKKIMVVGAFQFLIVNYAWLVDTMRDSFVMVGLSTNEKPMELASFLDPSALIDHGFSVVAPILETKIGFWGALSGLGFTVILKLFCVLFILVSFVLVALQVFLILVEFYIVTTLSIILLPFGIFKPTSFLADRAIGSVFANCVKLMVLAFTVSLALPILMDYKLSADPTLKESFSLLAAVLALSFIIKQAPSIAMSMMSGSAGLELGSVLRPVSRAMSTVSPALAGAASAVNNMPGFATKTAMAFKGGLGGAAQAASNMSSLGGMASAGLRATAGAAGTLAGKVARNLKGKEK